MDPTALPAWLQALLRRESGGNWGIVNDGGYSGGFQFGEGAARDSGTYTGDDNLADNRFDGSFEIPGMGTLSYDQWLQNPQAQLATMGGWTQHLDNQIRAQGLDRYVGQTVNGVPVTMEGLYTGAHLGGMGGLESWLTGGGDRADSNGTRVGDYVAMGSGSAGGPGARGETRWQQPTMSAPTMAAMAPAAGGQQMAGLLGPGPQPPRQSWLGGLLGIEPDPEGGGLLGSVINPQNASDRQAVMQMAAALLQASGPSTEPRGFGTSLGAGLQGYAVGQEIGAKQDDRQMRRQTRQQVEAAIAALPPEQQAWARANPDAFAQLMLERQFAGPAAPINAGGGLFLDPTTMQPVADYRQPDAPPRPIVTDGGLVLSPDGTSVVGDYRTSERGPNTAGLPTGLMWDPTGAQAIPIPGVPQTGPDLTALQENLIAAGLKPGTPEFRQAVLAATAGGTTVNVDTTGANGDPANISLRKMQEALGTELGAYYSELMNGGQQANVMLGDINQIEALLAQTPQGTLAPLGAELGGIAQSLGIDVGGLDPSSAQAVASIVARIVPGLRPPGSGTTSDRDLALFQQSLPSLSNTPQGNQVIVAVLRAMAERRAQEGQIATSVATGQVSPAKAQQVLASLGPYISPELAQAIASAAAGAPSGQIDPATIPSYQPGMAGPVRVTSEAEFLALPPGTSAVMPDGTVVRRP